MKTLLQQQLFFANVTERQQELLLRFTKKGVAKKVVMDSWRMLLKNNFILGIVFKQKYLILLPNLQDSKNTYTQYYGKRFI